MFRLRCLLLVGATNAEAFGYQEAWADYRSKLSLITGQFRSQAASSLDVWHLAQDLGSGSPALTASFLYESPPISRLVAVTTQPHFQLDVSFVCFTLFAFCSLVCFTLFAFCSFVCFALFAFCSFVCFALLAFRSFVCFTSFAFCSFVCFALIAFVRSFVSLCSRIVTGKQIGRAHV